MNIKYILLPYLVPLFAVILLNLRKYSEKKVTQISFYSLIIPFITTFILIYISLTSNNFPFEVDIHEFHYAHHHFSLNFYIDEMSIVVLALTGYLSLLVGKFSHTYLHREIGFQRFFRTINLFVFGLHLLALAGTMDLFFAAWEIIGLSSFLLIAFYRDRTRPVINAFRIYGIYRFCDVGLLFGAILGHILFKEADHFKILLNSTMSLPQGLDPMWINILGSLLVLSSIGKSAQFPFFNWPARAMEGPTPSSAIFYGALSIHCGALLLYRTYPLWSGSFYVKTLIISIAILTIIFATGTGRIQSNIKGQLAYASVVQISFMFIEVALGLHKLFLLHFICHCLLRCTQILTSPSSIVDYVKTMDLEDGISLKKSIENILPKRIKVTIFSWALQEGFLSPSARGGIFIPLIVLKTKFKKIISSRYFFLFLIIIGISSASIFGHNSIAQKISYSFAFLDLIITLRCLSSDSQPIKIWYKFGLAQICFFLSVYIFNSDSIHGIILFSYSAAPAWILGWFSLKNLPQIDMHKYNGLYSIRPRQSLMYFISFVVLTGLPFSTTFWGEDIIFNEIFLSAPILLVTTALSIMLNGLLTVRILVKTFWGFPEVIKY